MERIPDEIFIGRAEKLLEKLCKDPDCIFHMIDPRILDYDAAEQTLTIGYPVQHWMQNGTGCIHGGIVCSMLDTTLGVLACCVTGGMTPTINLNVSFARPAPGTGLAVNRAKIISAGHTVVFVQGEAWSDGKPDEIVATAVGEYRSFTKRNI